MKKSYLHVARGAPRIKDPGQVPNDENIQAIRDIQKPAKPFTMARYMSHDEPRFTVDSITDSLGLDMAQRNDWSQFLDTTIHGSPNEVILRQSIMSKCINEHLDTALRNAILQRSLSYWKGYRKSMTHVYKPEQLLQKAEARGGSYHRRVPKEGGGYRYYYDEDKYKQSKDAHTNGKESQREYISGKVQKCIEGSGSKGCGPDAFRDLVKKYGAKAVADIVKQDTSNSKYSYKKGKFILQKTTQENVGDKKEKTEKSEVFMIPVDDPNQELLEKAVTHKYISRKKDAHGNWVYTYPEDKKNRVIKAILDWLKDPAKSLTTGSTARYFRIDKGLAGQILRELESAGKVKQQGGVYVGSVVKTRTEKMTLDWLKDPRNSLTIGSMARAFRMDKKEAGDALRKLESEGKIRKVGDAYVGKVREEEKPKQPALVIPQPTPEPKTEDSDHAGEGVPKAEVDNVTPPDGGEAKHKKDSTPIDEKPPEKSKVVAAPKETKPKEKKAKATKKSRKAIAVEQGEHVWGSRADMFVQVDNSSDLGKLSPSEQAKFATKKNLLPKTSVDEHLDAGKTPGYVLLRNAVESAIQAKPADNQTSRERYMDGITFVQRSLDAIKDEQGVHDFIEDFHYLSQGFKLDRTISKEESEQMVDAQMAKEGKAPVHDWKERVQWEKDYSRLIDEHNDEVGKTPQDREKIYVLRGKIANVRQKITTTKTMSKYDAIVKTLGLDKGTVALKYHTNGPVKVYVEDPSIPLSKTYNPYGHMADAMGKRFDALIRKPGAQYNGPKAYTDASKTVSKWKRDDLSTEEQEAELRKKLEPKKKVQKGQKRRFKWEREVPGEIRRTGGQPVETADPAAMAKEFGFPNVQFGNWVTESDAESHIKGAHGALLDLSDMLGIDRKTVSLNGRLALAIGSRGSGTASAHYESSKKIINLTKMAGGGSLAHEWAHAMDNIMAVAHDPKGTSASPFISDGDTTGIPGEVADAYENVVQNILYKEGHDADMAQKYHDYLYRDQSGEKLTTREKYMMNLYKNRLDDDQSDFYKNSLEVGNGRKNSYWVRKHEMFARAFESYIEDKLVDQKRQSSYLVSGTRGGGPYPAGDERKRLNAAMDKLVQTLQKTKALEKSLQRLYILQQGNL